MFGWGYVIEYCISLFKKEQEEKLYKNYVAECARIVTENTAKILSAITHADDCKYIGPSFEEMMKPKPIDKRTAEEVIEAISDKLQKIGGEIT